MKYNNIQQVRDNNSTIYALISNFISSSNTEGFILEPDGNIKISDPYKKIIALEIEKIQRIYQTEFPRINYKANPNINILAYIGNNCDACFGYKENAIKYSYGIKKTFEELRHGKYNGKKLGYTIDNKGRILYKENGNNQKLKCNLFEQDESVPYLLKDEEAIENDYGIETEQLYFYLNESKYENYFFSVMPHELGHAFGFGTGLFEGLTEEISREISKKYNLINLPFARQDFVKFIQSIEKIIGRDNLVENANLNNNSVENTDEISKLIGDKANPELSRSFCELMYLLNSQNNLLEEIKKDKFDDILLKKVENGELNINEAKRLSQVHFEETGYNKKISDSNRVLNQCFSKASLMLDEYIKNNPDKVYELGSSEYTSNLDYSHIIEAQENEISVLKDLLKDLIVEKDSKNSFFASLSELVNDECETLIQSNDNISSESHEKIKIENLK